MQRHPHKQQHTNFVKDPLFSPLGKVLNSRIKELRAEGTVHVLEMKQVELMYNKGGRDVTMEPQRPWR